MVSERKVKGSCGTDILGVEEVAEAGIRMKRGCSNVGYSRVDFFRIGEPT